MQDAVGAGKFNMMLLSYFFLATRPNLIYLICVGIKHFEIIHLNYNQSENKKINYMYVFFKSEV